MVPQFKDKPFIDHYFVMMEKSQFSPFCLEKQNIFLKKLIKKLFLLSETMLMATTNTPPLRPNSKSSETLQMKKLHRN